MNLIRRHLFLDLEDTVITPVLEGWFNVQLINVDKIRRIIAEWQPDFVHIFSFAIWNRRELELFNMDVRPRLESALGVKISSAPTVDDEILPACCRVMGISQDRVDFSEMSAFWSKHEAFRLNMRHVFKTTAQHDIFTEVMFLDDMVFNETFDWPDLQIRGSIFNINQLPEQLCHPSLRSSSTTTTA